MDLGSESVLESGMLSIDDLLHLMVERGASDLHLKAGSAPMIRIDGELTPATYEILTPDSVRSMIESILTDEQKAKFVAEKELDLAYSVQVFRVSASTSTYKKVLGEVPCG